MPIIIFYDSESNPVFEKDIFDHVIELSEEHGQIFDKEWEADKLLPQNYQNKHFTKEMDIMDVWFDSGSTSIAVNIENIKAIWFIFRR